MLTVASQTAPRTVSARPLRIGLFGGYGIGNFGNDASLEAILSFLRAEHPEAELSCICSNPAETEAKFGLPAITTQLKPKGAWRIADTLLLRQPSAWTNWVHSLRQLGRYDVVLVAGTGVFDDFRDSPLGWPSRLLRWCLAARLRGVRVAFVSVGGGPILNPVSRALMKRAAQLAQHRSYRDANSRTYMMSLGVDDEASAVLPDLAFLLPAPPASQSGPDAPLTVGLGIMNYRGWRNSDAIFQDYVEKHVRFIEWLEAQGHTVRLVIGQAPADLVAIRAIEARLGRSLIGPREAEMNSFHDAMVSLADVDVVVASRYHTQIGALKLGKPLLSLSYAPKNDALLADAGIGEFTQTVDEIDFDLLTRNFTKLVNGRAHYAAIVRERVGAMEERLRQSLKSLDLLA